MSYPNIGMTIPQPMNVAQSRVIEKKTSLIEFPNERRILWNRTPEGPARFIYAQDVLPQLYISSQATKEIIDELSSASVDKIERTLVVEEIANCTPSEKEFIESRTFHKTQRSAFILKVQESGKSEFTQTANTPSSSSSTNSGRIYEHRVTMPISVRPSRVSELQFEKNSTVQMIQNLGKSIKSCRDFALRSSIRIRAAGWAIRDHEQVVCTTFSSSTYVSRVFFLSAILLSFFSNHDKLLISHRCIIFCTIFHRCLRLYDLKSFFLMFLSS